MEHYVYWVHLAGQNIATDGYIGVTNNVERRWKEHKEKLHCPHFAYAILKYGELLIWEIVYTGTGESCYAEEAKYRPAPGIGWNIAQGGYIGNNLNRKLSESTRQKLSEAKKGKPAWNKGKTKIYSEETLEKIRNATKNRVQGSNNPMFNQTHTKEAREKISKAHKGKEGLRGIKNPSAKPVMRTDTGETFTTITEAATSVGVTVQALSMHLRGITQSCKNIKWQYL